MIFANVVQKSVNDANKELSGSINGFNVNNYIGASALGGTSLSIYTHGDATITATGLGVTVVKDGFGLYEVTIPSGVDLLSTSINGEASEIDTDNNLTVRFIRVGACNSSINTIPHVSFIDTSVANLVNSGLITAVYPAPYTTQLKNIALVENQYASSNAFLGVKIESVIEDFFTIKFTF